MLSITKTVKVVLVLLIVASALIASPLVNAFQEGWENSPVGTYVPTSHDSLPLPLIPADEGDWLLGDTVSEFPECGSTPHTAEILLSGVNRSLRLTSYDSISSCADNVWVNLFEVPPLNLNPGFSVPLTSGTIISFEETGNLINPGTGSPYCVLPPCGDTVSLTLEDTLGNMLAYVLQRSPDAVPNEVRSYYREVFLDPNAGAYSRNLFADFSTIPDFNPSGVTIRNVAFEVKEHGTATIDNICIGTSGCVPPLSVTSASFSANPTSGNAPLNVSFTDESTGTITSWYWDFGDGSTSTLQNPSHTYTDPGTYTVSLTIVGAGGTKTETKTDYITVEKPATTQQIPRYRLYNPYTYHHHYTTDANEYNALETLGWIQEGTSCYFYNWYYVIDSAETVPYYRLYNPNSFEHHWTTDANEYDVLGTLGWIQEGADGYVFASQVSGSEPLYRLYNPNDGLHHWTMDTNERTVLTGYGFIDEGIACYVFP